MPTLLLRGLALLMLATRAFGVGGAVVDATFHSATDVPVTANGYTATGSTVNLTLNFAPSTGTQLMVVKNTSLGFIGGTFSNLAQGQEVALTFGGVTFHFVANYFGGTGNDLVLHWAGTQVYGWGYNGYGQLGNNSTSYISVPVGLPTLGVLAGKTVIAVSAGAFHSLALCSDGTVAAWGYNVAGQTGNNTTISSSTPVSVSVAGTALEGKTVIAVVAGYYHSLALCSDGTVAAWGYNHYGQLGNNSRANSSVPVAVSGAGTALAGRTVIAVSAGDSHSLALCSDGTVVAWGSNGNLGLPDLPAQSLVPVAVSAVGTALAGKTVIAVSAGGFHSLALCSDGTVAAWGDNRQGQLGNGLGNSTFDDHRVPIAVRVKGTALAGKTVIAIAAGSQHSLALCSDGTVTAWGDNSYGQLGNNGRSRSLVPVKVSVTGTALAGKTVTAVSAGNDHSLTMCSDGTEAAWGYNRQGQLGNDNFSNSPLPVAVSTSSLPTGARVLTAASGAVAYHNLSLVASSAVAVTLPETAPVLNKYTGLYEWLVQVKNNSPSAITGVDLFISGLPSSVSVWNGVPVYGEKPFTLPAPLQGYRVHYGVPVGADVTVTVVIEFFSKTRPMPKINPTITTSIVPSDNPPGKGQYGIPVSKVTKLAGRGNLVQFRSVVGSHYRLWYSVPAAMVTTVPGVVTVKDSNLGWLRSPVAITAYGTVTNWMDEGPPKTIFTPLDDPTRQYRVELQTISILSR